MRREKSQWDYRRETSIYKESDYRSRFYKGKWEKAWLKEAASYAVSEGINLFDGMWKKYVDKNGHMPGGLFKFFPFNQNSIKCIETNNVFMNNPKKFNDPFDCVLCASKNEFLKQSLVEYLIKTDAVDRGVLTQEELYKLEDSRCDNTKCYNIYKTFDSVVLRLTYDIDMHDMKKDAFEISDVLYDAGLKYESAIAALRERTVGITSFSNISLFKLTSYMELWAHYAQNHEGFCVEYDMTKTIDDDNINAMVIGSLLPCNYSTRQIVLSKRKIYKYIKKIPFTQHEQMEFDKSIILSFLTKSSSWEYENEWRLIIPVDICELYGNMIPFFPIKAIYIGCRMPADNKECMYRLAQRKGIPIYDMDMHEYRFDLEVSYSPEDVEEYFKSKCVNRNNQLQQTKYRFWKQ